MTFQTRYHRQQWLTAFITIAMTIPVAFTGSAQAQDAGRFYPETGKTVRGKFLAYWEKNGGLAQQGFPISEEMQERSDTDGKTYTVQYFERAVFELHPENQPPFDVLLQLLGVFAYKQKYSASPPAQTANTSEGSVSFSETGRRLGGVFLDYWRGNGGLAQQGFPISDEFQERSDLDGKTYTVQYFERAVFELHPENQKPYDVLLSQLGTIRYRQKYLQPSPTPTVVVPTPTPGAQPTSTPAGGADCSNIPASQSMTVTPACAPAGSYFRYASSGFRPGEYVGVYTTLPNGEVYGPAETDIADSNGRVDGWFTVTYTRDPQGVWATTMEGLQSKHKAIGYFKVTAPLPPDCSGIPANVNMQVSPNCAVAGAEFELQGGGFEPGETVARYYTSPSGDVIGSNRRLITVASAEGRVGPIVFATAASSERGVWVATFEGLRSGRKGFAYFKVQAP